MSSESSCSLMFIWNASAKALSLMPIAFDIFAEKGGHIGSHRG